MAEHDSCLAADQSGGAFTPPLPDDPNTDYGVEVASLADAAEEMLSAAAAAPSVARYYQGRACTAMKRTKADIDQVVVHTPEGGESGTLSVLNGTGASFDWFLPLSGSLYRCNDYLNYVAWQAGHWGTNLRSIGIEQGDYASRSGSFGDAHYRRLAQLCAYLAETLDLKIARARGIGQPGFVSHADITPGARTDPGAGFLWDKLLEYTLDYRRGRTPGAVAPKPPANRPELVYLAAWAGLDVAVANAAASALKSSGFPKAYVMRTAFDLSEASRKALGNPARPCLVIGGPTVPRMEAGARRAFEAGERDRLLNCVGSNLSQTKDMTAWRLKALATRIGLDPAKVLATYRAELGDEETTPTKPPPAPAGTKVDKAIAYELALIDPPTDYGFWDGKFPFTPGPAMWANVKAGGAPDPKTQVPNASCTGLINLGNAAAGIDYRAGTLGYAKDLVNKRPFKLGMLVKKGEVLLDRFMETSDEDEGHIVQAIETGTDPRVISSDHRYGGVKPGVNVHRLSESYRLFDYDWIGEVPGLGAG